jgi:drug/metabolite transporter (DMT)-like permease
METTAGSQSVARGAAFGLIAAVLFGASAPLSKLLLPAAGPLSLSALLYLGGGLGLSLLARPFAAAGDARLRRADAPLLAGIVVAGGVAGPVLLLLGLERLPALTSALLLNLEAPFTMLLAVTLFGEHLTRREVLGAALIVIGVVVLQPGGVEGDWKGALAIAGACACWSLDNNLTQRLSLRDPIAVARFKTLAAGAISLALALALKQPFGPPVRALALGAVSYGVSLALYVYALRILGAARGAALFATAPFAGALLAIPILGERASWRDGAAALLMASGVAVFLRSRHSHRHVHEPVEHDHVHVHDEHHQHAHDGPVSEPHSHPHRHGELTHEHPHVSDAHHRHSHRPR